MPSYLDLLFIILPVFAVIAVGVLARRVEWVAAESEGSLIKLVVNILFPCLIYNTVTGNFAASSGSNLVWAPIIGFATTAFGIAVGYFVGRWIGLSAGQGLRTFALAAGIGNYGYLPLPIVGSLWGPDSQVLVLIHNIGVESALWTVGVLVMSGLSLRDGWRKLLNPIVISMVATLALNYLGLAQQTPIWIRVIARWLGGCAIPMGLFMIGVSLAAHLATPGSLFKPRVSIGGCLIRLGLIPFLMLAAIRILPVTPELKRVLVIEAAMPSAVFPIILAKLYGGQPLTAVQVVLATTAVGILAIPFWIRVGLTWIG